MNPKKYQRFDYSPKIPVKSEFYFADGTNNVDSVHYLTNILNNCLIDPGYKNSEFAENLRHIMAIFNIDKFDWNSTSIVLDTVLKPRNYDILLVSDASEHIVGHAAFQASTNKNDLNQYNMFNVQVDDFFQRKGIGTYTQNELFNYARSNDVELAKLGDGNSDNMNKLFANLQSKQDELGVKYIGNYTFRILNK